MEYVEKAFRYLIKHSRGQQFKSLRFYYGPTRDWDIPEAYHKPRSIFHATSTARDGQEREISVRHINDKEVRNSHSPSTSYDSRQAEQEDIDDYMNSMPPAILSRMISALGVQADETSLEVPDPGYDVRTGGLQSELGTYEADWKASHGILPLLKRQLQKRKEEGWDLWEMPLMEGKGGKASFLYDRLRAG